MHFKNCTNASSACTRRSTASRRKSGQHLRRSDLLAFAASVRVEVRISAALGGQCKARSGRRSPPKFTRVLPDVLRLEAMVSLTCQRGHPLCCEPQARQDQRCSVARAVLTDSAWADDDTWKIGGARKTITKRGVRYHGVELATAGVRKVRRLTNCRFSKTDPGNRRLAICPVARQTLRHRRCLRTLPTH